tara:strand:+ start:443 stop:715 length:273 start_codon:yes stop_codon:yes gene_type:complete
MFIDAVRKILKWMPLILLLLLLLVDRDNTFHKFGYIFLLISYSIVIVLKILHAKKEWHKEFDSDNLGKDQAIKKMGDYQKKLNVVEKSKK